MSSGPVSFAQATFSTSLTCAAPTPDYTGLLVCDAFNHVVLLLNFTTGIVTVVAGAVTAACVSACVMLTLTWSKQLQLLLSLVFAGVPGVMGDSTGPVASATLNSPTGVALMAWGDIFILSSGSQNIKRLRSGLLTTVAGAPGGSAPPQDGPALNGTLSPSARGLVGMPGRLFFTDGNRIRAFSFPGQMPPFPPMPPMPPMPPTPPMGPPAPPPPIRKWLCRSGLQSDGHFCFLYAIRQTDFI